jgi:hypothetical protein
MNSNGEPLLLNTGGGSHAGFGVRGNGKGYKNLLSWGNGFPYGLSVCGYGERRIKRLPISEGDVHRNF